MLFRFGREKYYFIYSWPTVQWLLGSDLRDQQTPPTRTSNLLFREYHRDWTGWSVCSSSSSAMKRQFCKYEWPLWRRGFVKCRTNLSIYSTKLLLSLSPATPLKTHSVPFLAAGVPFWFIVYLWRDFIPSLSRVKLAVHRISSGNPE